MWRSDNSEAFFFFLFDGLLFGEHFFNIMNTNQHTNTSAIFKMIFQGFALNGTRVVN
jgi:hypothetical protein